MGKEITITNTELFSQIKNIIDSAKQKVVLEVNSTMTAMYWEIGNHINQELIKDKRAEYGSQLVSNLAKQLQAEYGTTSFSEKNLRRMMQFATMFPERKIVATLLRQFSWSHFTLFIPIQDELKRSFYMEMCRLENWSVRTLREKIDGMLYERTAISKKSDKVIKQELENLKDNDKLSPDLVFKDPYFLDFLGLHDTYSEKDLENAILAEMEKFLCEMGTDFGFIARQKRITIDNEDYYIDLLFSHRRLHCLVVVELKLGEFKASYKGQMELYLRWLEKNDHVEGENAPIGLILCAGKNSEHVELMHLEENNIRVAEYMTKLPDQKLLEQKLNQAIEFARNRLEVKEPENGEQK
jgi:predicted nuclease of restriction endonuclease-like (RecB) superfamily